MGQVYRSLFDTEPVVVAPPVHKTAALWDFQVDVNERSRAHIRLGKKRVLVQSETGSGKCLGRGTPVMMHDGSIRPVETIQVSDLLMGPDSQPRRVLSLANGVEQLYRIVPVKGDPYVVNESHILSLKMTPKVHGAKHTIENISIREYFWKTDSFRHQAKGYRVPIEFPIRDVPLDPYFLGLWLADGAAHRPIISKPDKEVETYLLEFALTNGLWLSTYRGVNGTKCPSHSLVTDRGQNNHLLDLMRSMNLINNKHVPDLYRINCRSIQLQVLAGMLDGDGSLLNNVFEYSSIDKPMAEAVVFMCRSVGLAAYMTERTTKCQTGATCRSCRVSISGDTSIIPCKIGRKKATPRSQIKSPLVYGIKVEPIGKGEYFGFALDGCDKLFLLGDFTVTHNTFIEAHNASECLKKGRRCLILADRRKLVKQIGKALKAFETPYGVIMAEETYLPSLDVIVASRDTLAAWKRREMKMPLPFDLVMIDEAHRSMGDTYQDLATLWPNAIYLGYTATPCRGDGKLLSDFWQSLECAIASSELIRRGYLVQPEVWQPTALAKSRRKGMRSSKLWGDPVEHWRQHALDLATIAFSETVKASVDLKDRFVADGIAAEHIDGSTPDTEREHMYWRLQKGVTKILCSVDLLIEGIDIAEISCAILWRKFGSIVEYRQACGRTMRPCARIGKKKAVILDHTGASGEHGAPGEDIDWSLDDKSSVGERRNRDIKDGKVAPIVMCRQCGFGYSGRSSCPQCGEAAPKVAKSYSMQDSISQYSGVLEKYEGLPPSEAQPHIQNANMRIYTNCLYIAAKRNGTYGMVAALFRKQTGKWPDDADLPDTARIPPWPQRKEKIAKLYPDLVKRKAAT